MSVAGREIVAVVDLNQKPVLWMRSRVDHHAARRRENGGLDIHREIHALVHGEQAVERIDAPAVAGRAIGRVRWRDGWDYLLLVLGVEVILVANAEVDGVVFMYSV